MPAWMPLPTPMTPGITQTGTSLDGRVWHILGQTYTPLYLTESSFGWHALLPPGTFVPTHVHPTQDEFVYILGGELDLLLDAEPLQPNPGDLIRLPRCVPHAVFNNSQAAVTCLFWVAPTRLLWDLFESIDNISDASEVIRLAGMREVEFLPPPSPQPAFRIPENPAAL
jgi:uncharacterized RmlC-like cupin family protein